MCGGQVSIDLQRVFEGLRRQIEPILSRINAAQVETTLGGLRHQTGGLAQRSIRFIDVALLRQGDSEIEMCPKERWIERDCLAELLDTGLQITSFGEKLSKIAPDLSVVRIDPQRLFEMSLRSSKLTTSSIEVADVVMGDSVARFYFDGL